MSHRSRYIVSNGVGVGVGVGVGFEVGTSPGLHILVNSAVYCAATELLRIITKFSSFEFSALSLQLKLPVPTMIPINNDELIMHVCAPGISLDRDTRCKEHGILAPGTRRVLVVMYTCTSTPLFFAVIIALPRGS